MFIVKKEKGLLKVNGDRRVLLELMDKFDLNLIIHSIKPKTLIFKKENEEVLFQALKDFLDDVLFSLIVGYSEVYKDFVEIDLEKVEHTPMIIESREEIIHVMKENAKLFRQIKRGYFDVDVISREDYHNNGLPVCY